MWLCALRSSVVKNNKATLHGNNPTEQIHWELAVGRYCRRSRGIGTRSNAAIPR